LKSYSAAGAIPAPSVRTCAGAAARISGARRFRTKPHRLRCEAPDEERAVVCALLRPIGAALHDLTSVLTRFSASTPDRW
jgi:hypothetical protein